MTPFRWLVACGCLYELLAVTTDKVPTITATVQHIARLRAGRFVLWLWLGFWVDHFIPDAT